MTLCQKVDKKTRDKFTFFTQKTLPKAEAEGHDQESCHRGD